ncbi:hypothetical protein THASP1DRAFT_30062 [Thamnocephalis sphaerospora]|uniref:C2H2-type domain-containing protein n=1 Tax=Thamnocephalis sphaerospora TaxID=78915 RepID=A0A4P9XQ25_9FUNG|nr:hypothetical protein THASP1DRAFT_30062 [Thamnocephalis sphaerospora]|eukprot:RKP08127.1 hypothetical protein THASP1DRAFT_30062 [Thamnocephalis sphaerospora]
MKQSSYIRAQHRAQHAQPLRCVWEKCGFQLPAGHTGRELLDHWRKEHGAPFRATDSNAAVMVACHWGTCNKQFRPGSYSAEAHIRGHLARDIGWKEFKCTACHVNFTRRPDLTAHMKKKHSDPHSPAMNAATPAMLAADAVSNEDAFAARLPGPLLTEANYMFMSPLMSLSPDVHSPGLTSDSSVPSVETSPLTSSYPSTIPPVPDTIFGAGDASLDLCNVYLTPSVDTTGLLSPSLPLSQQFLMDSMLNNLPDMLDKTNPLSTSVQEAAPMLFSNLEQQSSELVNWTASFNAMHWHSARQADWRCAASLSQHLLFSARTCLRACMCL